MSHPTVPRGRSMILTERCALFLLFVVLAACSNGAAPAPQESTTDSREPTSAVSDPVSTTSVDGLFAVSAGGRELAMVCWGEGSPTVILETGGANVEEWTGVRVVRELAGQTKVCTYDRAGTGGSDDPPNERRDADDVINDLSALLVAADVGGPYVLLGRSFGGMIVTYFADKMPDDVVGVIVLDTPAPSATFTEESEPELVWNAPGNTEHLDVVNGFENRFADEPPNFEVPLLLITPSGGESSAQDQSFWLQVSPQSRQVELSCGDEPMDGQACVAEVVAFVSDLRQAG